MIRRAFTALGVLGLVLTGTAIPALAQSVPFTDPNTAGYIGLCDPYGHNVTGGSVDATPFVWKSVASSTPPAQYTGQGQNSVLEIHAEPSPSTASAISRFCTAAPIETINMACSAAARRSSG